MQSSSIINAVKTETLACFMPCVLRANCESLEHLSSSWSVLLNAGAAAMQETKMEARKRARGEHFTFRKCPRHNAMVRPCAACTHSPSFSPQASAGVAIDKKLRTRVRPALVQQQRKCKHSNMQAALSRQVVGGTGLFDGVAQRAAVQLCIVRRVAGPYVVAALCTWD